MGVLTTRNGAVATPFFMPDATRASVRGLSTEDLRAAGVMSLVVNTYHLFLQPGADMIAKAGGIHRFMGWDGPILSDSGGYQVFSLIHKNPRLGKVTEEGALFRSVRDGTKHLLTPERSIQIQFDLGVDMMVVLDDPRPNDAPEEEIAQAVERTIRWALRCKGEYNRQIQERHLPEEKRPLLFGVIQGGMSKALRKKCAEGLISIGFDGYGFGARHIAEDGTFLEEIMAYTASLIPENAPRFALGVGTPSDIVRSVQCGWDLFDCVIPTREGRHGRLFLWKQSEISNLKTQKPKHKNEESFYETINIQNERFKEDFTPIDPRCDCFACQHHTKAYMRHLFMAGEPLGARLASIHNVRFYIQLMERIRGRVDTVIA